RLYEAKDFTRLADLEVRMWVSGPGQSPDRVALPLRERVREMILSNYTTHTVEGQPVVLDPPAAGRLAEIRVPTLVVLGDLDETGVLRAAEAIANGIPGARKVVIPGTAHMLSMEKPAEFIRLVLEFLQGLPAYRWAPRRGGCCRHVGAVHGSRPPRDHSGSGRSQAS